MNREQSLSRYQPFPTVDLPQRAWPGRSLVRPPRWLSTDLRDGNQALAVPMSPRQKLALFDLLVRIGYKEIEVGFPVASRDEHEFVRMLIEQDRIPDDVLISVMVPAREELIRGTVDALRGARRAAIHVYNATCPTFRSVVFGLSRSQCKELAVRGAQLAAAYAEKDLDGCEVHFQYSPELFNETEPDFALEVCEAVMDVWEPEAGREIVLNFPATVERATPNVFADQIELLDRGLSRREHVCLSVHPHNDRGTAVAAAELAMLAGAQRVEGCLFGGGERAGNVCLVTLGLNFYSQGMDPGIDFSELDRIRAVVEECTGAQVAPRHPYAGELVYSAFSGSHQDAINKGFQAARGQAKESRLEPRELPWAVPYLPIDPEDVGRGYDAVVRINSQSGKGGIAYVMNARHGLSLPRDLQVDFAPHVQALSEAVGELTPLEVRECFAREYLRDFKGRAPIVLGLEPVAVTVFVDGAGPDGRHAQAAGTLATALAPWGVEVVDLHLIAPDEAACTTADEVRVYAACRLGGRTVWGAAAAGDPRTAAYAAVRAAVARAEEADAALAAVAESLAAAQRDEVTRTPGEAAEEILAGIPRPAAGPAGPARGEPWAARRRPWPARTEVRHGEPVPAHTPAGAR